MNITAIKSRLDELKNGQYCYMYQAEDMFKIALQLMQSEEGKRIIANNFSNDERTIESAIKSFAEIAYMAFLSDSAETAKNDADIYYKDYNN